MDCAWPFQAPRTGEPSEGRLGCGESGITLASWSELAVAGDGRGMVGWWGDDAEVDEEKGGGPWASNSWEREIDGTDGKTRIGA